MEESMSVCLSMNSLWHSTTEDSPYILGFNPLIFLSPHFSQKLEHSVLHFIWYYLLASMSSISFDIVSLHQACSYIYYCIFYCSMHFLPILLCYWTILSVTLDSFHHSTLHCFTFTWPARYILHTVTHSLLSSSTLIVHKQFSSNWFQLPGSLTCAFSFHTHLTCIYMIYGTADQMKWWRSFHYVSDILWHLFLNVLIVN